MGAFAVYVCVLALVEALAPKSGVGERDEDVGEPLLARVLPSQLPSLSAQATYLRTEKWNISCHISKQGCHSHRRFQPSRATRRENSTCDRATLGLQPLTVVSTEKKHGILAADS